jgi:hypothetical protein
MEGGSGQQLLDTDQEDREAPAESGAAVKSDDEAMKSAS